LTRSSNLVGCSTGKSAGLAPLNVFAQAAAVAVPATAPRLRRPA
jgi:hypothetical protein